MMKANLAILFLCSVSLLMAQHRDEAIYKQEKSFSGKEKTVLRLDITPYEHVRNLEAYDPVWHTPPIPQDTTGTCWCFSATSFLESELKRMGRGEFELSRMYTVYWEYVDKVTRWVREKGESLVDEGSQHNAVIERMKKYGAMPAYAFTGFVGDATRFNHAPLMKELSGYLDYVKENELWDETQVIINTKAILDKVMGTPPETFVYDGRQYTPKQFFHDVLTLDLDDYVAFISFKKVPFWTRQSYDVPDNWWKSEQYHNVPLQAFYQGIKTAIKNGYSVAIAGDVSEPGKYGLKDIAVIPTFDIPSEYIDQDAREYRFYNKSSTDDHGVHLIGYHRYQDKDWFLIKDSASSAFKGEFDGYHFFNGDYIKLKILAFMVHKDGVKQLLSDFEKNSPRAD